jgi:ABC-type Mn2+/Zn2+ transport system ATPase subunit
MGESIKNRISIKNLKFEFSKNKLNRRKTRIIVDELDFKPGSYSMITGNNGSGKSSLINMIIFQKVFKKNFFNQLIFWDSYIKHKEGDVTFYNDQLKDGYSLYKLAGYSENQEVVDQFVSHYKGSRNELEEIKYNSGGKKGSDLHSDLELKNLNSQNELEERLKKIYKHFDYEGISKLRLNQMSEGQLSLTFLINRLLANKFLYIFDEPLNGLDKGKAKDFNDYLKKITEEEGKSVLVISHCFNNLEPNPDNVYSINPINIENLNIESYKLERVDNYHLDINCACVKKVTK